MTGMSEKTEVLLQLYAEERAQARQSEDQRAALTNIIIVLVGAGLAFMSQLKLEREALPLSIGMMVIGIFGALACAKYFERWYRHWSRAYAFRAQLFEMHPDIEPQLSTFSHSSDAAPTKFARLVSWILGRLSRKSPRAGDVYETQADARFPIAAKVKLYRLWVGFHCVIFLGGAVLTAVILD
jgi:hypothetical protein